MTMKQEELNEILRLHKLWLVGDLAGKRADLRTANLSTADLSSADLRLANLRDANLSDADLRSAELPAKVFVVSVSGIGSCRRMTTYRADTDEIWCGCFKGTLSGFAKKVREMHKYRPMHLAHYRAAVAFFRAYKKGCGL